jgi:hypothetical protein
MSAPFFAEPLTTATDRSFMFASDFWRFTSCDEPKNAARFSDMAGDWGVLRSLESRIE